MADWLDTLINLRKKEPRLVAGVMTGTSADSIDVALCEMRGAGFPGYSSSSTQISLKGFYSLPLGDDVRKLVLSGGEKAGADALARFHARMGDLTADAIEQALAESELSAQDLDLVGMHGQTVFHHSGRSDDIPCSFQLGDGDRVAERFRVPVFCDFRARDIAAAGEGAPLTPYSDRILYSVSELEEGQAVAILNLGGISNVTLLTRNPTGVIGFDTGPANAPLDRLATIITEGQQSCDLEGKIAAQGSVKQELLEQLLREDDYFKLAPPKSTGVEKYGDSFIERCLELHEKADADLMATLVELISVTVADAIQTHLAKQHQILKVVVAGGGVSNPVLFGKLKQKLDPIPVIDSDELGVPSKAREAMAFAIFANESLSGVPCTLPAVTGARRGVCAGKLALP